MESANFLKSLSSWADTIRRLTLRDIFLFAKRAGLSMPQLGVLIRLHHEGSCAVSEIAAQLDITTAASSQMIDRLVQQGWLVRSEDPYDRRSKLVALTGKGAALVEESLVAGNKWMSSLAEALSPEQQAEIVRALHLLAQAAHDFTDPNSLKYCSDKPQGRSNR
jgi:DNA-binding MarR family transcriptional regulator